MIIKKYIAKTEQDAVEMAKTELGQDAVIMNVKKNEPKGLAKLFRKSSVELTAAIDEVPESEKEPKQADFEKIQQAIQMVTKEAAASKEKKEAAQEEKSVSNDILPEPVHSKKEDSVIEQRLNNLQDLLEKQMQASREEEQEGEEEENPVKRYLELIRSQLIQNEVEPSYADQILDDLESNYKKDVSLDKVLSDVYQKIVLKIGQPQLIDIHAKKSKFIFFIGPSGVGKTTTIAKIASTLKLSKKVRVALVTSDTYRIAAVEQLKTYANILGIPLKVIYTTEEMTETAKELEEFDLVFIDTAGRSHNNMQQREDLQALLEIIPPEEREIFLVLSATTKYKDLVKISQTYQEIIKYNLIFTKLDETDTVGNIYNIRMLTGAPLSYLTWGQNVPDDIGKVDAQKIAKQLLGGNG